MVTNRTIIIFFILLFLMSCKKNNTQSSYSIIPVGKYEWYESTVSNYSYPITPERLNMQYFFEVREDGEFVFYENEKILYKGHPNPKSDYYDFDDTGNFPRNVNFIISINGNNFRFGYNGDFPNHLYIYNFPFGNHGYTYSNLDGFFLNSNKFQKI